MSLHTCPVCTAHSHILDTHRHTHRHTDIHTPAICHGPRLLSVSVLSRGAVTWSLCPVNPSHITASAVCCFIYTWSIDVLKLTPRVIKCPFLPREHGRPFPGNRSLNADKTPFLSWDWLDVFSFASLVGWHVEWQHKPSGIISSRKLLKASL